MRTAALFLLVVSALFWSSGAAGARGSQGAGGEARGAHDQFRRGLMKERVDGDLEAAIAAYELAAQGAGDDRSLSAWARLRIGRCLEKLGRPEARGVFDAILRDYPDHAAIVTEARMRLAEILPEPTGFADDFSAPTLDPGWVVVEYVGPFPRAHGFTTPANAYSLTANPGHLRYIPDRMTHADGFQTSYEPRIDEESVLRYDAGLELHRHFSGNRWLLESKATYEMPFSNARFLKLVVLFGDGSPGSVIVDIQRFRDGPWPVGTPETTPALMAVEQKTGPTQTDTARLAFGELPPNSPDTYFYRVERDGGILSASWSTDGSIWETAFVHDLGDALDGLQQRVILSGGSWFAPGDSFADYDYIRLTPR